MNVSLFSSRDYSSEDVRSYVSVAPIVGVDLEGDAARRDGTPQHLRTPYIITGLYDAKGRSTTVHLTSSLDVLAA